MKTLYFRYAQLVLQHEGLKTLPELDYEAIKLLEIIAVAHDRGSPLTVSQAMRLINLASPASIHRKLRQLRDFGYIEGVHENGNRRTQFLTPTHKANVYFERLGTLMQLTTSSNAS